MKNFALLFVLLISLQCGTSRLNDEKWILSFDDTTREYIYQNEAGEVKLRLPEDQYANCFTDTFVYYAIVYHTDYGLVGIDKNEKVLFNLFNYDNGYYEKEGFLRIVEDGKMGFANQKGQIVIAPKFDAAYSFSDSLAAVCQGCTEEKMDEYTMWVGGKWGFIDTEGKMVIPAQYDRVVAHFENGKATVILNGEEVEIDKP